MPYRNIFKKIIYCADFCETSQPAFRCALNIASANPGCVLVILHVVPEPDAQFWRTYIYEVDAIDDKAKADIDEKVREAYLSKIPAEIPYETKMAVGSITTAILDAAKTENASLIIMGRESSSVWKSRFMGNITEHIARKSPCPVMVVPAGETSAGETGEA
ncbi:MAG: universal stress protein [Spirochaetales bacterium]|jgi:nucleotide-binding universal stress UspA family protein|nr:universal stress protein [Spirochaetales bacterium]